MTLVEEVLHRLVREHNAKLEEAAARALVTGTHGVAEVADAGQVNGGSAWRTTYTFHITPLVPWGEVYSFPTVEAWERFKARHAENQ